MNQTSNDSVDHVTRISQIQKILPGTKSQLMRISNLLVVSVTSLTQIQKTYRFTLNQYISIQNDDHMANIFLLFQLIFVYENELLKSKNNGQRKEKAK